MVRRVAVGDARRPARTSPLAADGLPWSEHASAVERTGKGANATIDLLMEGPLLQVATFLSSWRASDLRSVRVSLPDRLHSPRSFEGVALMEIIYRARRKKEQIGFPGACSGSSEE